MSDIKNEEEFVLVPKDLDAAYAAGTESNIIYQFTASWCLPCKAIASAVTDLAKEHQIVVLKIDVSDEDFDEIISLGRFKADGDDAEQAAKLLTTVSTIPTFVAVTRGTVVDRLAGTNAKKLAKFFLDFSQLIKGPDVRQDVTTIPGESKAREPEPDVVISPDEEKEDVVDPAKDENVDDDDDDQDDEDDDQDDEDDEEQPFGSVVMPNPNLVAGASFINLGGSYVSVASLVHVIAITADGGLVFTGGVVVPTSLEPIELAMKVNRFFQEALTPEEYIALVSNK